MMRINGANNAGKYIQDALRYSLKNNDTVKVTLFGYNKEEHILSTDNVAKIIIGIPYLEAPCELSRIFKKNMDNIDVVLTILSGDKEYSVYSRKSNTEYAREIDISDYMYNSGYFA